ncbi:hypothetical protein C7445_11640 [Alicyclobacillus sacchari]|uniref:Uncharacterized protein n=2 Tax=Alicyclobacillus sacchari TaxID=392010 RepID=A0A4R8LGU0_9BACL|nr:hypothetical protein C7445_11640 [Alicyclobacillus sacchari]
MVPQFNALKLLPTVNEVNAQMNDELHRRYAQGENITAQDWMAFYDMYPSEKPQIVDIPAWNMATSNDHLWELWGGIPFHEDGIERDRLAVCLLYSMGLRHFVELLPEQSRDALRRVLDEADDQ